MPITRPNRFATSLLTRLLLLVFVVAISAARGGVVAYFPLDGGAFDASGNGHNGTVLGATTATGHLGNAGGALSFDGVDDKVSIGQLLSGTDDATVAFWAKSSGAQNGYAVLVSQGHSSLYTGFAFQRGYPNASELDLISGVGGASWNTIAFPNDLATDLSWHHYAFTKSGNDLSIYFDGALSGSSSTGIVFDSFGFTLGDDTVNSGRNFFGVLDEVYVYNTALTGPQINAVMTAIPEPGTTSRIVACLVAVGVAGRRCLRRAAKPM